MEPASVMCGVSFRKVPRVGQAKVFELVDETKKKYLNISLPTGYGKTFVGCGAYAIKKKKGEVNRLLMVVTSLAQLNQFEASGEESLRDSGNDAEVSNINYHREIATKQHRRDQFEIFVVTAQTLLHECGSVVREMMETGRWMVVVDEYHHYGLDKAWGEAVLKLPAQFVLAMSATPHRPDNDSAFGEADYTLTYRRAFEEGAVKELRGHSYVYRLDLLGADGGVQVLTTNELAEMAGGTKPEQIDAVIINRKLRWSPRYISPLVTHPIERMTLKRLQWAEKHSPYPINKLQVLIKAMSVSHAELVCKQIETMYDDVTVNWVGTGPHGRKPEENERIIKAFLPGKDKEGNPTNPELDVLVQVGIAGEGLDTVTVSEVVFLTPAKLNNTDLQLAGRASRRRDDVVGYVSFDSCSEFADLYKGTAFMDAMNYAPPEPDDDIEDGGPPDERDYDELPDWPEPEIANIELAEIDMGSPDVVFVGEVVRREQPRFANAAPDDPEFVNFLETAYRQMRKAQANRMVPAARARMAEDNVKLALSRIVGLVIRTRYGRRTRVESRVAGDVKKTINQKKARAIGKVVRDEEVYKRHYQWLKGLEAKILEEGLPTWLE